MFSAGGKSNLDDRDGIIMGYGICQLSKIKSVVLSSLCNSSNGRKRETGGL